MNPISGIPFKIIFLFIIVALIGYLIGRQTKSNIKVLTQEPAQPIKPKSEPISKPDREKKNTPPTSTEGNKDEPKI